MSFEINFKDTINADDVGGIRIRFGGEVLTRLIRPGEEHESEFLCAPAGALAKWLLDRGWRLRYEPIPGRSSPIHGIAAQWRVAHDLRAVASGYPWPAALLWSDGEESFGCAQPDPVGITAPVRFTADVPLAHVPVAEFERGVDTFLAALSADTAIKEDFDALRAERLDGEQAAWRRLEACLGFDPDEAPDDLMTALGKLANQYGETNVEEAAAAAPGSNAASVLQQHIAQAADFGSWECTFPTSRELAPAHGLEPTMKAENLAASTRKVANISGPVTDERLGELCGTSAEAFQEGVKLKLRFRLRVRPLGAAADRVIVKSRRPENRRFQFARALGDVELAKSRAPGSLGPLADSNTARQKFQRAFAAALLCPIDELWAMLPDSYDQDDIDSAAEHFRVSPYLVAATLANHNFAPPSAPPWPDYAANA